jgi:hypothetical protein
MWLSHLIYLEECLEPVLVFSMLPAEIPAEGLYFGIILRVA